MTPEPLPLPLAGLLRGLAADPGRPRLTWYGDGGERTELSGHVLDNWVTKTTNLLVQEFSAGPGTVVLLDLPVHWRTVLWAFAVWRCGACLAVTADRPASVPHDVLVTDRPTGPVAAEGTADVIAVALPALARSIEGELPPGVMDATSAVMTYGDVLTWLAEADTSRRAMVTAAGKVSHAKLLTWARNAVAARNPRADGEPAPPTDRVLVQPGPDRVLDLLSTALTVYADAGSLVVCSPAFAAELAADPARREHLIATERVTAELA